MENRQLSGAGSIVRSKSRYQYAFSRRSESSNAHILGQDVRPQWRARVFAEIEYRCSALLIGRKQFWNHISILPDENQKHFLCFDGIGKSSRVPKWTLVKSVFFKVNRNDEGWMMNCDPSASNRAESCEWSTNPDIARHAIRGLNKLSESVWLSGWNNKTLMCIKIRKLDWVHLDRKLRQDLDVEHGNVSHANVCEKLHSSWFTVDD